MYDTLSEGKHNNTILIIGLAILTENAIFRISLKQLKKKYTWNHPGNRIFVLLGATSEKKQDFPRDFSRCENPAGFHGIRDNPVIPWNFENPVPAQTDRVESVSLPVQVREI